MPLKLRERFKVKKIERTKPLKEKARKLKRKKIYVKEKCHFVDENGVRCTNNCIGNGQLCKKHGGTKDLDNVLSNKSLQLLTGEGGLIKKFNPLMPLLFVDLSRQGFSDVEIAAEMEISVYTLRKWSEDFEEFSIAYDIGQALHESWWLEKGKEGLDSRTFNTSLFKFLTGNKLGYADKVETKNLNVNTHGVLVVPAKQSLDEWEAEGIENDNN